MVFNLRRFSQDPVENSFSIQRNSQGGCNNPDPQQVDANVNNQNTLREYNEGKALSKKRNCDLLAVEGDGGKRAVQVGSQELNLNMHTLAYTDLVDPLKKNKYT